MKFYPDLGDDEVYTPDLMRWEVFDRGTGSGKLFNAMSVPNAYSRRVDMTIRPGHEYAQASPDRPLRTDEMVDRPEWWTSEGGEMPHEDAALENYDE